MVNVKAPMCAEEFLGGRYYRVISGSLLLAVIVSLLNEFLFYLQGPSKIFSIIFIIFAVWFFFGGWYKSLFILLLGNFFLLATRPRSLHLIELDSRGEFEYFSPNILSIVGPSVSTLVLFLLTIGLMFRIFIFGKNKLPGRLLALVMFMFYLLVVSAFNLIFFDDFILGAFLTDIKYPLFVLCGGLLLYATNISEREFLDYIVIFGVVLGFISLFMMGYDFSSGDYQLQFNHHTYFSIIALGVFVCYYRLNCFKSFLVLFVIAVGCLPIIRGAQISLFYVVVVSIFYLYFDKSTSDRSVKLISVMLMIFLGILYVMSTSNELTEFVIRKASLFIEKDLAIDSSSIVRVLEFEAIFLFDDIVGFFQFLFGKGYGGTFSFHSSIQGYLTLADYPLLELIENKYSQPHLFLYYFVLKYGVIGSLCFLLIFFIRNRKHKPDSKLLVVSFLPLMWQGYWSPGYALFTGMVLVFVWRNECFYKFQESLR